MTCSLNLRGVPVDLARAAKGCAAYNGLPLVRWVELAIRAKLQDDGIRMQARRELVNENDLALVQSCLIRPTERS